MKLSRTPVALGYLLLAIIFVGAGLLRIPQSDTVSMPEFALRRAEGQTLGGLVPAGLWQIDSARLQSSINRLQSVRFGRELGNSIRLALGQRIDWIVWGGKRPLMLFPTIDLWVSRGLTPEVEADLSSAAATITNYSCRLAEEGWVLVVVPVPTKLGIQRELSNWPIFDANLLSRDPILRDRSDEVYGYLSGQLKQRGVKFVDLQSAYRSALARSPGLLLYATNDSHWSGAGIELAAGKAAEVIAEASPLQVRTPDHPTYLSVKHVGDLVKSFDPLPGLSTWLSPAWIFDDKLVNGEEGRGYEYAAAPTGLVVVVGTSYTGQYTWLVNQPVGFTWQIGLHLKDIEIQNRPIAGHGSFVAFQDFWKKRKDIGAEFAKKNGADKPKIVVWEFPIRDIRGIIGSNLPP